MHMENDNKNRPGGPKKNKANIIICVLAALFALTIILFLNSQIEKNTRKEISYTKFVQMLKAGEVSEVTFDSNVIYIKPKSQKSVFEVTYYTGYVQDTALVQDMLNKYNVDFSAKIDDTSSGILSFLLAYILPFAGMWIVLWLLMRMMSRGGGGGGIMGVGKSTAKMYVEKKTGVTFKDVAGQEEAMESLNELVDFLNNPGKYTEIGAKLPKGALLVGPPGTGKTLLAKAVAGEANVPFFSISGSEFVEMFVGMGASKVRDLFKQANEKAPCIVFIDEIDTIGKKRDNAGYGGNDEREQTLNQLLAEMDGFDASKGVVILAATNRPDSLDPALLRPGRFDRRIPVELPDLKGREEILKVHAKKVRLGDDIDFNAIARAASGASGAELANILNEAAIIATKSNHEKITMEDIEEAEKKVTVGLEKHSRVISEKDKRLTAYHEAGHAIVSWYLPTQTDVKEISIIPRGMAGGYTMYKNDEDKSYISKTEMEEKLIALLGGRAAEKLAINDISTGASNDIEVATQIAKDMIVKYGMNDMIGPISLKNENGEYILDMFGKDMGDQIGKEVKKLIDTAYNDAQEILRAHRDKLDMVAEELLQKEKINEQTFRKFFEEDI